MNNIDNVLVNDAILTLENESAFYQFFWLPYQKNLIKKIKKGVYSNDLAIKGLQEQIRCFFKSCSNMQICKYQYKYIPTVYNCTKKERVLIASGLIENFELDNL